MSRPRRAAARAWFVAGALALGSLSCAGRSESSPEPRGGAGEDPGTDAGVGASASSGADEARGVAARSTVRTQTPPTAVVALPAAEASTCERMCGEVGDCLRADGRSFDASHLELACLDVCVHVEASSPAAKQFHGCAGQSGCEALLGCADRHWDAAQAAREDGPVEVQVTAKGDPCQDICVGVYSCMLYDKTPQESIDDMLAQDPSLAQTLDACEQNCDPSEPSLTALAACTTRPTCGEMWECWETESSRY